MRQESGWGKKSVCVCVKGKKIKRNKGIKAVMETHRKWQTGRQRGGEKERRTGGIRVSLLMFVSESPQARPLRSSATRPHFTMSYSLSLHLPRSPSSNPASFVLSLHLLPQLYPPPPFFFLQGQTTAVTNQKKNCTMWHVLIFLSLSLSLPVPSSHSHPSSIPHYIASFSWLPSPPSVSYRGSFPSLGNGSANCWCINGVMDVTVGLLSNNLSVGGGRQGERQAGNWHDFTVLYHFRPGKRRPDLHVPLRFGKKIHFLITVRAKLKMDTD